MQFVYTHEFIYVTLNLPVGASCTEFIGECDDNVILSRNCREILVTLLHLFGAELLLGRLGKLGLLLTFMECPKPHQ